MTAVLAPAATDVAPALGTPVAVHFLGRHASEGLVAHWVPSRPGDYVLVATCGWVSTVHTRVPYTAEMALCPKCFDPSRACPWCGTHCDDRAAHQHFSQRSAMAGKPTLLPDGALRQAPAELRLVAA